MNREKVMSLPADVQCRYRYKQLSIENMTFADPTMELCKGRIQRSMSGEQFNDNFMPISASSGFCSQPNKVTSSKRQPLCKAEEVLLSANLNGNK